MSRKVWKRRLLWYGPPLVLAWLALSYFWVRPACEEWLRGHFEGDPSVRFALLWPHLDVTAFGVDIEAKHHRLHASRVGIDVAVWSLFGARPVQGIHIAGLQAQIDEGARVRLFRSGDGEGSAAGPDADLDPLRLPPITFSDPAIDVRRRARSSPLVRTSRLAIHQTGERTYEFRTDGGVLAGVPFEKLTGRFMPRGTRFMIDNLKLRSFNGVLGGFVDVDLWRAGRVNGEIEWHLLEVEEIWRTYGLPFAEKRRGDLSGKLVFSSTGFSTHALQGKGTLKLERAEFFSPLSFKVFLVLEIPSAQEAPLNRADMTFSFENGIVYIERAKAFARTFDLDGQGLITFDGRADLEVRHAGTTVAVRGTVKNPKIKVLPFDHITLPFDRLFRERIRSR